MANFDITAVLNVHGEGLLLKPSMDSIRQCFRAAQERGISTELVVVLDRADTLTKEVAAMCTEDMPHVQIIDVDNGDLGLSRNDGATAARGEYVAFLDGDDMWGKNWLHEAFHCAVGLGREAVWHPEVNVYFGGGSRILLHPDSDSPSFRLEALALENCWTALCFVRRAHLLQYPYVRTRLSDQVGYEDWGWNLRTLAAGIAHKVVRGTGHAIREKPAGASLLGATTAASCLTTPSSLFRRALGDVGQRVSPNQQNGLKENFGTTSETHDAGSITSRYDNAI